MAAADFCLITVHVAMHGAVFRPHARQISPDKVRELSLHNRSIYPIS
jgi:hypothetical protein